LVGKTEGNPLSGNSQVFQDHWPPVSSGFEMEFVEANKDGSWFKIVWSPHYKTIQEKFYMCVQSYDPNSFQALLQVANYLLLID
jgi:hypothetical protein